MGMALQGSLVFGVFPEVNPQDPPLLKYAFTAPRVREPGDWAFIDEVADTGLSVTLRNYAADCSRQERTVAIVSLFDNKPLGDVFVQVFNASGSCIGTVRTNSGGTAQLVVPSGVLAFALANHTEYKPGVDAQGKKYKDIAHYST